MSPWDMSDFKIPDIPTMITPEEQRYLYWLGAHYWQDVGHIVEVGPWLGGSTACLARGMRDRAEHPGKRLHVFDNFIWRDFMADRAALPMSNGDCFQPYFERNLADFTDLTAIHRQALPDDDRPLDKLAKGIAASDGEKITALDWDIDEPVEILFIDGAKSWTGFVHLLSTFRGALMDGRSLLVCQDYKFWGSYWVPMIMEYFKDHFVAEHNLVQNTVSFRLIRNISAADLSGLPGPGEMSIDRGIELLESCSKRLLRLGDRLGALILQGCKVRYCLNMGNPDAAIERFRTLESAWPGRAEGQTINRMRSWLETETGTRMPPSLRWRSGSVLRMTTQLAAIVGNRMR